MGMTVLVVALLLTAVALPVQQAAAQCPACYPNRQALQIRFARTMVNNDLLSFSYLLHDNPASSIQPPFSSLKYGQNNQESLVIKNVGSRTQLIDGLKTSDGHFKLTRPSLSIVLAPQQSINIIVTYVGHFTCPVPRTDCTRGTHTATFTISSRDKQSNARMADNVIQLRGLYQYSGEISRGKYSEPTVFQIGYVLGLGTDFGKRAAKNDLGAPYTGFASKNSKVGEEVYVRYFIPANPKAKVTVWELAAFRHMDGPATLFQAPYPTMCDGITDYNSYFGCVRGSVSVNSPTFFDPSLNSVQQIYPRLNNGKDAKFEAVMPNKPFGFAIGLSLFLDSLTDNAMPQCLAINGNNPALCGNNAKTFPVRDRTGKIVPNTYVVLVDNFAGNYDYQDHVYLFSNVKIYK